MTDHLQTAAELTKRAIAELDLAEAHVPAAILDLALNHIQELLEAPDETPAATTD